MKLGSNFNTILLMTIINRFCLKIQEIQDKRYSLQDRPTLNMSEKFSKPFSTLPANLKATCHPIFSVELLINFASGITFFQKKINLFMC